MSDPQADAFMRSYLRQPDDSTARLVFADWLDEQGGPGNEAWARYIRAKYEATKHPKHTLERRHAERIASAAAHDIVAKLTIPADLFVKYPASLLQLLPPRNIVVDLEAFEIPRDVVELMPESVARENLVLPLLCQGRTLIVANSDLMEKLDFILNVETLAVGGTEDGILEAINRHYGLTETESVDSILVDFTDTVWWNPTTPPVARLLALIVAEAINLGADRVLFVPAADHFAVRVRNRDGWTDRDVIPLRLHQPLVEHAARLCGWASFPAGGHIVGTFHQRHSGFVFAVEVQIASGEFGIGMQFDIQRRFEIADASDTGID